METCDIHELVRCVLGPPFYTHTYTRARTRTHTHTHTHTHTIIIIIAARLRRHSWKFKSQFKKDCTCRNLYLWAAGFLLALEYVKAVVVQHPSHCTHLSPAPPWGLENDSPIIYNTIWRLAPISLEHREHLFEESFTVVRAL